jgi:hypothetical protein
MLYELLYTSEAVNDFNQQQMLELLNQARTNNQRRGVTGLLIYHKKEFMQLIEGEKEEILELWRTIKVDKRHYASKAIYHGAINERGFSDWSIAFQNIDKLDISKLIGFSDILTKGFKNDLVAVNPSTTRNLMLSIKNNYLDFSVK